MGYGEDDTKTTEGVMTMDRIDSVGIADAMSSVSSQIAKAVAEQGESGTEPYETFDEAYGCIKIDIAKLEYDWVSLSGPANNDAITKQLRQTCLKDNLRNLGAAVVWALASMQKGYVKP